MEPWHRPFLAPDKFTIERPRSVSRQASLQTAMPFAFAMMLVPNPRLYDN